MQLKLLLMLFVLVATCNSDKPEKCPKDIADYECPAELEVDGHLWTGYEVEEMRQAQQRVLERFAEMAKEWETNPPVDE